jgi:hypothetical protein
VLSTRLKPNDQRLQVSRAREMLEFFRSGIDEIDRIHRHRRVSPRLSENRGTYAIRLSSTLLTEDSFRNWHSSQLIRHSNSLGVHGLDSKLRLRYSNAAYLPPILRNGLFQRFRRARTAAMAWPSTKSSGR